MISRILPLLIIISCSSDSKERETLESQGDTTSVQFYSSGNPHSKMSYRDGKVYGPAYTYFDKIDTFLYKKDGEYFKATIPSIKTYSMFNSLEQIAFEWNYNEKREAINSFGSSIVEYWAPEYVNQNDSFKILMFVPDPPFSNGKLQIKFESENKRSINVLEIREPRVEFDTLISNPGEYNVTLISSVKSKKSDISEVDSVKFTLTIQK